MAPEEREHNGAGEEEREIVGAGWMGSRKEDGCAETQGDKNAPFRVFLELFAVAWLVGGSRLHPTNARVMQELENAWGNVEAWKNEYEK